MFKKRTKPLPYQQGHSFCDTANERVAFECTGSGVDSFLYVRLLLKGKIDFNGNVGLKMPPRWLVGWLVGWFILSWHTV